MINSGQQHRCCKGYIILVWSAVDRRFKPCLVKPIILKVVFDNNQNSYIEEEQTTQWSKEKVQKDKQRSTNHTYKT